ncbi:hypothetical protein [Nonomuraea sp. NPDC050783]|uniref:hypothetical protein n=1 Tax=Nonomuraea sp. NPDC050783 TaxID=3154634 RepID=UPI003465EE9A
MTNTSSTQRTDWHLSLIGGLKRRYDRVPARTVVVTPVGGLNADLSGAGLAPETTLTKVSLAGGVTLRVPAGADVRVTGFHLFGGRHVQPGKPAEDAPVVHVRAYGLFGGVAVTRA